MGITFSQWDIYNDAHVCVQTRSLNYTTLLSMTNENESDLNESKCKHVANKSE